MEFVAAARIPRWKQGRSQGCPAWGLRAARSWTHAITLIAVDLDEA
jgi:hypothetical protein